MSNAIVFGAGQMGVPVAYALKTLGHDVTVYDSFEDNIEKSKSSLGVSSSLDSGYLSSDGIRVLKANVEDIDNLQTDASVVVSALPFWCNLILAQYCIDKGIPYCDLGGDVDTTDEIIHIAKQHARAPIATDQGLAPGLVNITAEQGCELLDDEPYGVFMAVGGLPQKQGNNPLNYINTWSVEGLINEYKGAGWGIIEGKKIKLPALEGAQNVTVDGEELEAFYTSGGTSHTVDAMLERDVQYCAYKTLRYPGHRDLIDFLMNKCKYSDRAMANLFKSGCSDPEIKDTVRLYVDEWCENGLSWHKEHTFFAGSKFSAMQRSTGYSIAAIADLLITKRYKSPNNSDGVVRFEGVEFAGKQPDSVVTYEMLNVPDFHKNFDKLLSSDAVESESSWI